ncbi:MAG TPA: hypothetical protein VM142_15200 [Acidimicrobiales bacterium]|nr:hypothetical protein [Acidimicrobiales bacterium]
MGVVAERGGWVTVAEPGLGLEHLSLVNEMGGDTVAQTMQRRTCDARSGARRRRAAGPALEATGYRSASLAASATSPPLST